MPRNMSQTPRKFAGGHASPRHCAGFLLLAAVWILAAPVSAQEAVTPSDVHANVVALHGELELLRVHLEQPLDDRPQIVVRDAAPREVYFQARSLANRTARLVFEHRQRHEELPPLVRPDEVRPADVLTLVLEARRDVAGLLAHFGIDEEVELGPRDPERTPTDVYLAVVKANRQLNRLTSEPYEPSDVWMEVTLAVSYAARLLAPHGVRERIPRPRGLEPDKEPRDVYKRLLECFRIIRNLASLHGLQMMEIEVSEAVLADVEPSDVHGLATLVVAELGFIFTLREGLAPPVEPYQPGSKVPADVYQRVGVLRKQLERLLELETAMQQRGELE